MKWIPLSERKPPNDVYVLVARYDGRENVKSYNVFIAARINDGWVDDTNGELIHPKWGTITHWMTLPDPPNSSFEYGN